MDAAEGGLSWLICGNSVKRGATGSALWPVGSAEHRRPALRAGWGSWDAHRTARRSARRGLRCGFGWWLAVVVAGAVTIAVTAELACGSCRS